MLGVTPGTYRNKSAAELVAKGYSYDRDWVVITKIPEVGFDKIYKPIMILDYDNDVKRDGWFI